MENEVEIAPPLYPWKEGLPEKHIGDIVIPVRFEQFEEPSAHAYKMLGYDEQGLCCYYRHQFMLTREVLDDEDNFYLERAYFEKVQSWKLKASDWLRYSETGGTAGNCRDHGFKTKYEITPCRPR